MKLIIISDNGSQHRKINFSWWAVASILLIFIILVMSAFNSFKYSKKEVISENEIILLNKFDLVLIKAAKLEGQVKRLNRLGQSIAAKNKIDIKAYLMAQAPPMGGAESIQNQDGYSASIATQASLTKSIDDLELELELQEHRFEAMKLAQKITQPIQVSHATEPSSAVFSYSTPVNTGYVSSSFGKRLDPINGHQRHHNGIDIAAKHGSEIHAIASGFVTFSGRKTGYGNVIDIHHSDTLKSRYAHLDTINVEKGEVVRKGDIIATMGQTGRATGSHLHLEVWEKDQPVNPESYIDTALIK